MKKRIVVLIIKDRNPFFIFYKFILPYQFLLPILIPDFILKRSKSTMFGSYPGFILFEEYSNHIRSIFGVIRRKFEQTSNKPRMNFE